MGFVEMFQLYTLYRILSRVGHKMCATKRRCRRSRWQCDLRRSSAGIDVA